MTEEEKVEALTILCNDFEQYAELNLKIKTKEGSIDPLKFNTPQRYIHQQLERQLKNTGKIRAILLKGRQQGACLAPSTLVLKSDFSWVAINDVDIGDRLLSVDEELNGLTTAGRHQTRKMRVGVVEDKRSFNKELFEIVLDNGTTLKATGDHRWMSRQRGGDNVIWRDVNHLKIGDYLRAATYKPETIVRNFEDGWIGGVLDADGSCSTTGAPRISFSQVDGDVLDRYKAYLDKYGIRYYENIDRRTKVGKYTKLGDKPVHCIRVDRFPDMVKLISRCNPVRFDKEGMFAGRKLSTTSDGFKAWAKVVSIRSLGMSKVIDIQTSEKTFIAEGIVSHNSTYTEGRFYWRTSTNFGKQAYILTHEQAATDNLFGMAKRYHDNCDPELKPSTGAANAKEMLFDKLDSGYKIGTAGSKAVGRSGTIQYFHGCLAAGTKIYSPVDGGVQDIELFKIDDNVLTHNGNIAPISYISSQEKECLSVKFRGLCKFPLIATKEHRFFTKNGWCELKDLAVGDSVGYPVKEITNSVQCLSLPLAPIRSHGGGRQGIYPDEIKLDYNFGRIVGLYLAEGHIKLQHKSPHYPVNTSFSVHRKEVDRTVEWVSYINKYYSKLSVTHSKDSLTSIITLNGNRLAALMLDLCGRTTGKHLPLQWSDMSDEFCKGMLHGYIAGDGHSSANDRRIRATSICSAITVSMRDVCASLGYGWASIEYKTKAVRSGRNEKEAFTLSLCGNGASRLAKEIGKPTPEVKNKKTSSIAKNAATTTEISNGYAWVRIISIENAGLKDVYDFEIEHQDHSYCTIHGASHNSELAFWPNAHEHFAGVLQCIPDAHGTEVILESTANGVGGKFHELWMQAINGEGDYIAIFVPWFWSPEYVKSAVGFKPTPEELRQQKLYGVTLEQLAWRRSKIDEMGKALTDQEYPYCWQDAFLASGRTVFDKELTAAALKECWKPKKHMVLENKRFVARNDGELRVWAEPKIGTRYVIGADVAEGLDGGDYSSADVRELPYGQQVAQWHGHIAPDLFGNLLNVLGLWYNAALLGVEVNNHGLTVVTTLRNLNYPNLYVQHALDDRGSDEKETKRIGWLTTSKSKPYIIDHLSAELRDGTHGLACKESAQEMQTYVVHENGSYGAQLNCNDDRVMSYAIAGEMLRLSPGYRKS